MEGLDFLNLFQGIATLVASEPKIMIGRIPLVLLDTNVMENPPGIRDITARLYNSEPGIRLAQALHHGTDHRSQICTALTTIGVEPPAIDVWDLAEAQGRLAEVPAPS